VSYTQRETTSKQGNVAVSFVELVCVYVLITFAVSTAAATIAAVALSALDVI
jgi:hypothetical protein